MIDLVPVTSGDRDLQVLAAIHAAEQAELAWIDSSLPAIVRLWLSDTTTVYPVTRPAKSLFRSTAVDMRAVWLVDATKPGRLAWARRALRAAEATWREVPAAPQLACESWLCEDRPLQGLAIALTRPRVDLLAEAEAYGELGATVIPWPLSRPVPPDPKALADAIRAGLPYHVVVVSSARAAQALVQALCVLGDVRILAGSVVAAVGRATAAALLGSGIRADLVPAVSSGEGVARELRGMVMSGQQALLVRAHGGIETTERHLAEAGFSVRVVEAYRVADDFSFDELAGGAFDRDLVRAIVWMSPAAVRRSASRVGLEKLSRVQGFAIGETTRQEVARLGLPPPRLPADTTGSGMRQDVIEWWHGRGRSVAVRE